MAKIIPIFGRAGEVQQLNQAIGGLATQMNNDQVPGVVVVDLNTGFNVGKAGWFPPFSNF